MLFYSILFFTEKCHFFVKEQEREAHQRATNAHRKRNQRQMQDDRTLTRVSLNRLVFEYDPEIDYSSHVLIMISSMDKECQYCHAFTYKGE